MATDSKPVKITIDAVFNAQDADIALVCTESAVDESELQLHVFKVHRKVLAVPSTVFEDMLDVVDGNEEDGFLDDLPEVRIEEDVAVINLLLASAYNKPELLVPLTEGKDWRFVLRVWEAANKYFFHMLKALCTLNLQASIDTIDDNGALEVFTRASVLEDATLAQSFVDKATNVPLHRLTEENIARLPPSAMLQLVRRHELRVEREMDRVYEALYTSGCQNPYTMHINVMTLINSYKARHQVQQSLFHLPSQ